MISQPIGKVLFKPVLDKGGQVKYSVSMSLIDKMTRVLRLDAEIFEEVEKDPNATREAFIIVVLAGISNGIGGLGYMGAGGLLMGLLAGIVGWLLWSAIIYLIGVKGFGYTSDMGELLRCLGFAYTPGIFNFIGILPGIGHTLRLLVMVWILVAFIIAVRQALDVDTRRAVIVSFLGFVVFFIFGLIMGVLAPPR